MKNNNVPSVSYVRNHLKSCCENCEFYMPGYGSDMVCAGHGDLYDYGEVVKNPKTDVCSSYHISFEVYVNYCENLKK